MEGGLYNYYAPCCAQCRKMLQIPKHNAIPHPIAYCGGVFVTYVDTQNFIWFFNPVRLGENLIMPQGVILEAPPRGRLTPRTGTLKGNPCVENFYFGKCNKELPQNVPQGQITKTFSWQRRFLKSTDCEARSKSTPYMSLSDSRKIDCKLAGANQLPQLFTQSYNIHRLKAGKRSTGR